MQKNTKGYAEKHMPPMQKSAYKLYLGNDTKEQYLTNYLRPRCLWASGLSLHDKQNGPLIILFSLVNVIKHNHCSAQCKKMRSMN